MVRAKKHSILVLGKAYKVLSVATETTGVGEVLVFNLGKDEHGKDITLRRTPGSKLDVL